MASPFKLEARVIVTPEMVESVRAECTPTEKIVWLTDKRNGNNKSRVHTFKGVQGRLIDLLLPDRIPSVVALDVGRKIGSFDGERRWRLTFSNWEGYPRWMEGTNGQHPKDGRVKLESFSENDLAVVVLWQGGMWAQSFTRLTYKPRDENKKGIFLWQFQHFYDFLRWEDVRAAADYWELLPSTAACNDLAELNRSASRMLYDMARREGWKKITLKDKHRFGLAPSSPQWQREERLLALRQGNASG